MSYTVYSDFDIDQHKKTFIHYLEVVIDENGKIMYAVPSHQEKIISLACEKLNVTREELTPCVRRNTIVILWIGFAKSAVLVRFGRVLFSVTS